MRSTAIALALLATLTPPLQAARVIVEAESATQATASGNHYKLDPQLLSGSGQFMHRATTPARAKYDVSVPEAGEYRIWAREFGWSRNGASAVRWRMNGGEWKAEEQGWGLPHNTPAGVATWHEWGKVKLNPGRHTFEFETTAPVFKISPATMPPPQTMEGGGAKVVKSAEIPVKDQINWTDQHQLSIDAFIFSTEPLNAAHEHGRIFEANGLLNQEARKDTRWLFTWDLDNFKPSILDAIAGTPASIGNTDEFKLRRQGAGFVVGKENRPFNIWGASGPMAPEHWEAEYYAKRARRLGINVVRLHTQDGELCNPKHNKNYILDPERMDRINYFVACLKKQGIYVMIDPLYNWVFLMTEQDGLPEGTVLKGRVRVQFYFDEYLQKLNKAFLKQLFDQVNPYTGVRNADDPAIAFCSVVNENSIFFYFLNDISPHHSQMLDNLFNGWLVKKYPDRAALEQSWKGAIKPEEDPAKSTVARRHIHELMNTKGEKGSGSWTRTADQLRFYYEVQTKFYISVKRYVHEELGGRHILFNGSGWWAGKWLENVEMAANLPEMDFYDQHQYTKGPIVNDLGTNQILHRFAEKRPAGIPWVATEWNDGFNVTGPLVMAAYGALQGWNGLFQYRLDAFDGLYTFKAGTTAPPAVIRQYPLASLAFARRYVREADVVWRPVLGHDDVFDATVPHAKPGMHPVVGRCETAFGAAEKVDVAIPAEGDAVKSITGELTWKKGPKGQVLITAPKLQGLIGFTNGQPVDLGAMTLAIEEDVVSVAAAAIDDKPLSDSTRIFLCATGEPLPIQDLPADAKKGETPPTPTGTKLPRGTVRFSKPVSAVYPLDTSGQRLAPAALEEGGHSFRLENTAATTWYEIVRTH